MLCKVWLANILYDSHHVMTPYKLKCYWSYNCRCCYCYCCYYDYDYYYYCTAQAESRHVNWPKCMYGWLTMLFLSTRLLRNYKMPEVETWCTTAVLREVDVAHRFIICKKTDTKRILWLLVLMCSNMTRCKTAKIMEAKSTAWPQALWVTSACMPQLVLSTTVMSPCLLLAVCVCMLKMPNWTICSFNWYISLYAILYLVLQTFMMVN